MTTEQPNGKRKLEAAISKVGKAYEDLTRVFEKNGDITEEYANKTFQFLKEVHDGSLNKAMLSLATAAATSGSFSLDDYEPKTATVSWKPGVAILPTRPLPVTPEGIRPGERLVGSRRRPSANISGLLDEDDDDNSGDDDAGFLDDE